MLSDVKQICLTIHRTMYGTVVMCRDSLCAGVQCPGRAEWGHVPIVLRPATKLSSHLSHHFYTITPSLCSATVEWKRKIVRLQDDNLEHEQFSFHLRIRVRLVLLNVGMWVFEVKYWLTAFRRCLPSPAAAPRTSYKDGSYQYLIPYIQCLANEN